MLPRFSVRLPEPVYNALLKSAEAQGRTINSEIIRLLSQALSVDLAALAPPQEVT